MVTIKNIKFLKERVSTNYGEVSTDRKIFFSTTVNYVWVMFKKFLFLILPTLFILKKDGERSQFWKESFLTIQFFFHTNIICEKILALVQGETTKKSASCKIY